MTYVQDSMHSRSEREKTNEKQRRTIDTNSREIAATLTRDRDETSGLHHIRILKYPWLRYLPKLSNSVLYDIVENTTKADPTHQMQTQST